MTQRARTTKVVRAGINSETQFGDVISPVHISTTFAFKEFGVVPANDYSRANNPTRSLFAQAVADLEGGSGAVATASGMGALTACLISLVPANAVVVAPNDCYGGTWRLLDALATRGSFAVRYVDYSHAAAAQAAIDESVALVLVESPSNPLLKVTDIAAVAALAHDAGALVVVDNTFASPIVQRPLELGADVVIHSATKYLAGHSDVVLGVIVTNSPSLQEDIAWWANCVGVTAGPIDAYLGLRGLRTLHLRMEAAQANAAAIAGFLDGHNAVGKVFYPGLPTHASHGLAKKQLHGFGAIVSFELKSLDAAKAFCNGLESICLAESLGGVETLLSHAATMTHAMMPNEFREAAGITDGLLRLSVGVEDVNDLTADIAAGLERALRA
ncbi:MAG: PLP-dependent aspartate aminotransferase family protein [Propionibacteriaceae bacterium]|jgi:cystathionine gamma-synthase|nr:PLP-dependent aspartate aminotransferase family protein [Propionibacteriaceae bacterium]